MSQFDSEILQQMVGVPPRPEVKPTSDIQIPDVPSASPAPDGSESNGQTKREWPLPPHLTPENDFMRDQAVASAPERVNAPDSPVVILSPWQLEALDIQANSAGNTPTEPNQAPVAPKRDFQLKGKLHEMREAGKELNKGNDLLSRLRRAKARVGDSVRKIAHLVTHAGETITGPIDALKDVVTVMVRNPEARQEIVQTVVHDSKEVAIIMAEPIVEEVKALRQDYIDELVALRKTSIKINGTEYIIVDEVIDTAVAAKDGVVQTARNAHELMKSTASWIKNHVQNTQELVTFHLTQAKSELAEIGNDRLSATGQYIDRAAGRMREILKGRAEYLRKASVASRGKAEAIALKSLERKGKIAEMRSLARPVPAKPEDLSIPTSSSDPRFHMLSDFEQQAIIDREEREAKEAPQSELHVNNPRSLSNTIL